MKFYLLDCVKVIDKYSPLYKNEGIIHGYQFKNGDYEYEVFFEYNHGYKWFSSYDLEKITASIKIGDQVKIREESDICGLGKDNPKDMLGEVYDEDLSGHIWVRWTNGERNIYKESDLKVIFTDTEPPPLPKTCSCEMRVVVNFGCKCEAGQAELAKERA